LSQKIWNNLMKVFIDCGTHLFQGFKQFKEVLKQSDILVEEWF